MESPNDNGPMVVLWGKEMERDKLLKWFKAEVGKPFNAANLNNSMYVYCKVFNKDPTVYNKEATSKNLPFHSQFPLESEEVISLVKGLGYKVPQDLQEDVKKYRMQMVVRSSTTMTVSEALARLAVGKSSQKAVMDHHEYFLSFGMSTSHTLRDALFQLFERKKLSTEAKFFVFFFASQIKNKIRIENAIAKMPTSFTGLKSVSSAKEFINENLVQYVTEESSSDKFAIVHLPTTMPGLDILCHLLVTPVNQRSINVLYERLTFVQIHLTNSLIEECRTAQKEFWEKKVMTTKNANNKSFTPVFQESFFNTSAQDKYNLVTIDENGNFREVPPTDSKIGYTETEIKEFLLNAPCWIPEPSTSSPS